MSDPEQPRTPDWLAPPTPPTQPTPPGSDDGGFAPLDEAQPPTQPVPPPAGYPPAGYPPPQPPPYDHPPPYQAPPYGTYVPYGYGYGYGYATPRKTNGMAVASLICGIVSIGGGFICLIPAVAAIPGLVLGIVGLGRINRSNGTEQGRGLAIGGIVTSAVGIVVLVLLVALFGFALTEPSTDF